MTGGGAGAVHGVMRALPALLCLFVLAGCGEEAADRTVAPAVPGTVDEHVCLEVWNAAGNEARRERIVREGLDAARLSVAVAFVDGPDAPAAASTRLDECAFLFHSDEHYLSFTGRWRDARLEWDAAPPLEGEWSDELQKSAPDNGLIGDRGRLEVVAAPREPAPTGPMANGPPPAWVETGAGPHWLSPSTFCWRKAGCADYVAPSCAEPRHTRPLDLRLGETVRFHLPFRPRQASLTFFPKERPGSEEPQHVDVPARRVISWAVDREGAFSLSAFPVFGGDASYVACIR